MEMEIDPRPSNTDIDINQSGNGAPPSRIDGDSYGSLSVKVDRQANTPMYVRMYCRMNGHHRLDEFSRGAVPLDDELVVYTWKDATLKELTGLIKEVHEESRRLDARFSFRSYFCTNYRGDLQSKDLGTVYNFRTTHDDEVTLQQRKYQQGDIIDVAIHLGKSGIAAPVMEADRYDDAGRRRGSNDSRRY